jgi:prefoldin alpha subunit
MDQQEYFIKLQTLEAEANQLGEQLKIIDQQVREMNNLKENVEVIGNSKDEEIFAELGKGIFIKAKLQGGDFLVDVGEKVFVPKNLKEINSVIDDQIGKFSNLKDEISHRIEEINNELNLIIESVRNSQEKPKAKKKTK